MMSDTLREFVESILSEITRYEEETGEKYDFTKEIKKYVTKSHPVKYAFTMTDIPKVGLNPQTRFNTPAGVYAFQLNLAYYKRLLENRLPYVSNAPYCNIMKLNFNAGKWLITSSKGLDLSTPEDVERVKQRVGPEIANKASLYGSHWNLGNDSKIFDLTYYATRTMPRPTVAWTNLLRELGYIGIYDPGNKVIHENEPMQLVCLDPKAYEWVETYETRSIRKKELTPSSTKKTSGKEASMEWAKSWDPKNYEDMSMARQVLQGQIKTSPEVLKMTFEKFPNRDKFNDITMNRSAPQEILKTVVDEIGPIARKQFEKEGWSGYGSYFKNMYLNPNCPPEAWDYIDLFMDGNALMEVLSSPKVPVEVLKRLYDKMTGGKRLDDAINDMGTSYQMNIKRILQNPNIPQDILKSALNSRNSSIRDFAKYNPNLPEDEYNHSLSFMLDPGTTDYEKSKIAQRIKLKPEDAIKVMKSKIDASVRQSILTNAKFTANDLDALTGKFTKAVDIIAIMNNKNVSLKTLRRLAQHPNANVSQSAKSKIDQYKKYGPPE